MSSSPLQPPGNGSLLSWIVSHPEQARAYLSRIRNLSNLELIVTNDKGATTRLPVSFSRENSTVELPLPSTTPTPNPNVPTQEDQTGGDVFGPPRALVDNVAVYQDASGKRIRDSGININDLVGGRIASYGFTDVQMVNSVSVPNGSGDTPMILDTAIENDYGLWSPGVPERFTFPTSGIWVFTGRIDYFANAAGGRLSYIRRNGSGIEAIQSLQAVNVSPGGLATIVQVLGFGHFAMNDFIELIGQQWSGGALNATYARMQAVRIDVSNVPGGGGGGADLSTIVCSGGNVVCSAGEVVWATP